MRRLALLLVLLAAPAYACTAFLIDEEASGMTRICYYDHLGDRVAVTVRYTDICAVSIQVRH